MPKKQTRRSRGEGSIFQMPDGRWCAQATLGATLDGKRKRRAFYGHTRSEAAKKMAEAVAASRVASVNPLDENTTLNKLLEEFLWTFKRGAVSDVTFEWYLNLAKYIGPEYGDLPIGSLTSATVQTLINSLRDRGYSRTTIHAVRLLLGSMYRHYEDYGLKNPVPKTTVPQEARAKTERREAARVIPPSDRALILAAAEDHLAMRTALTTLMFSGLRIGEFLVLRWRNIDFKRRLITIENGLTYACDFDDDHELTKRRVVVGSTKTVCGERTIEAPQSVMDVLLEWREYLPSHMRRLPKQSVTAPEAFVFPNDRGEMRTYDGFRSTYRRFLGEHGLPNYPLHAYRHTFATMLLEQGVNPKVVQKLLGHADIETTLRTYSHVLPEVYAGAAGALERARRELGGGAGGQEESDEPGMESPAGDRNSGITFTTVMPN